MIAGPAASRDAREPASPPDTTRRDNRVMAYLPRRAHDADAHIMEPPKWLRDHADPDIRDRIEIPGYANELVQTGDAATATARPPLDASSTA